MFAPEHMWHKLIQGLSNRRFPETTMGNVASDLETVLFGGGEAMEGFEKDPGVKRPANWIREKSACKRNIETVEGPTSDNLPVHTFESSSPDYKALHDMYCKLIPAFKELWDRAVQEVVGGLSDAVAKRVYGWDNSAKDWFKHEDWLRMWRKFRGELPEILGRRPEAGEEAFAKQGIKQDAAAFQSMFVGNVRFKADDVFGGSWALARPAKKMAKDDNGEVIEIPYFGQILNVFKHIGPDQVVRIICKMKWYKQVAEGTDIYHPTLLCPMISRHVLKDVDVMWCAKDIVPWTCFAMPVLRHPQKNQVMLARSWSVLRHLGFPPMPRRYPYTHLPPVGVQFSAEQSAVPARRNTVAPTNEESESEDENAGRSAGSSSEPEFTGCRSD